MINDYTAWAKIKPPYPPEPNYVPSKILQFAPAYHYSYDSQETSALHFAHSKFTFSKCQFQRPANGILLPHFQQ